MLAFYYIKIYTKICYEVLFQIQIEQIRDSYDCQYFELLNIFVLISEVKKETEVILRVQYVNGGGICMPGASLNV